MTATNQSAQPEGPRTIARHGQLKRAGTGRGILKLFGAALTVTLVSSMCVAGVAVWSLTSQLKPGVTLAGEENLPEIGAIEGGLNFLLVGSDGGEGNAAYGKRDAELNDVTMLMHISEDHSRATVVSFPRDLFVSIPACPRKDGKGNHNQMYLQKINQTLSYGGLACTALTVEKLTGLDIQFAAKIEMDGVVQMSTAVGGVPVCVATPIRDRQIGLTLSAGMHDLEGWDALQFLRTRYGVGDGSDLSRNDNQRVFLSSLVRTIKDAETLSDPVKVYGLAKAALGNMEMSNSLQNVTTLASIAIALKDIPLDDILFLQFPGALGEVGGQSGVIANTRDAKLLFDAIASDVPLELTGGLGEGATTDPNAPKAPDNDPTTPGSATPSPSGEPTDPSAPTEPTEPTAPNSGVELPKSIKGQTAGTETCSAGQ